MFNRKMQVSFEKEPSTKPTAPVTKEETAMDTLVRTNREILIASSVLTVATGLMALALTTAAAKLVKN